MFSGDSDTGEPKVTMHTADGKNIVKSLHDITIKESSKSTYNIDFISKIAKAIGRIII
jgi:hypothetical protein